MSLFANLNTIQNVWECQYGHIQRKLPYFSFYGVSCNPNEQQSHQFFGSEDILIQYPHPKLVLDSLFPRIRFILTFFIFTSLRVCPSKILTVQAMSKVLESEIGLYASGWRK